MCELGRQIEIYCRLLPLVASCQIHDLGIMSPSDLHPAVERLAVDTKGVGIVALDRPSTRDALAEIVDAGIRVVTLHFRCAGRPSVSLCRIGQLASPGGRPPC